MSDDKASINMQTPDLEALASEVCDMWQDYFAALASGAASKADLVQLLEPQRRLFADFIGMMQHQPHGSHSAYASGKHQAAPRAQAGAAPASSSSDDGTLRLAQLAHRVAELEKRLAKLEFQSGGSPKSKQTGKRPGH
jgi:hypothetical protein